MIEGALGGGAVFEQVFDGVEAGKGIGFVEGGSGTDLSIDLYLLTDEDHHLPFLTRQNGGSYVQG